MRRHVAAALANLRAARPGLADPKPLWNAVPVARRAGVLALLYTDFYDELACMVTVRSAAISYGGDAALPGGKADDVAETPYVVARREAFEEVGLPLDGSLDPGEHIEHVATLPAYMSSRVHVVVPSVAYLSTPREIPYRHNLPAVFDPTFRSDEVHSVFSVPLREFLRPARYRSDRVAWGGLKFPQHYFSVLAREKQVGSPGTLTVWGLTANILIDIARLAYNREPSFAHRRSKLVVGDQPLLEALHAAGELRTPRQDGALNFRRVLGAEHPALRVREAPDVSTGENPKSGAR